MKPCLNCRRFNTLCIYSPKLRQPARKHESEKRPTSPEPRRYRSIQDRPSSKARSKTSNSSMLEKSVSSLSLSEDEEAGNSETDSLISHESSPATLSTSCTAVSKALLAQVLQENNRRIIRLILEGIKNSTQHIRCRGSEFHDTRASGAGDLSHAVSKNSDTNKRKRTRSNNEKDREEDGADKPPPSKLPLIELGNDGYRLRFACPFFKHNRLKYREQRSCTGPGWPTVHRVKSVVDSLMPHYFRLSGWLTFRVENTFSADMQCQSTVLDAEQSSNPIARWRLMLSKSRFALSMIMKL